MVLSAHTDGAGAPMKFVTLIAQPESLWQRRRTGEKCHDAAHLDDTPRMRLVDAVDAMADNRGELLFEPAWRNPAPVRPLSRAARPGLPGFLFSSPDAIAASATPTGN